MNFNEIQNLGKEEDNSVNLNCKVNEVLEKLLF
jgi:hypothetical protein